MIESGSAREVFWMTETGTDGDGLFQEWCVYRYIRNVELPTCPLDRTCIEWISRTVGVGIPYEILPANWWLV